MDEFYNKLSSILIVQIKGKIYEFGRTASVMVPAIKNFFLNVFKAFKMFYPMVFSYFKFPE